MLQTILQTVVITVGAATMSASAAPQELPKTPIQVTESRVYTVREGDSLSQIAIDMYDNKDAWTTILADNPQINNPHVLEEGTVLKVRLTPPSEKEIAKHATMSAKVVESVAVEAKEQIVSEAEIGKTAEAVYVGGPLSEEQLTYLGNCEAGMDPTKNTGNGYYGAFQFSYGTWKAMDTGYERADLAPLEVQKAAVQKLLSRSSIFTQFPGCAKKMRSLGII